MVFYIFGKNQSMADNFSVQINIPVADHIYKYLISKCGTLPFTATRSTFIGSVVLSTLNRNEDVRHPSRTKTTKIFNVTIKEESYLRNGIFIDFKSAKVFNDLMDRMFREELYNYIMLNTQHHDTKYMECIRNFMVFYNINEEDIKEETVYRYFKRKKKQLQTRAELIKNT